MARDIDASDRAFTATVVVLALAAIFSLLALLVQDFGIAALALLTPGIIYAGFYQFYKRKNLKREIGW